MYNLYSTSVISLRSTASLSFSYNGHQSCSSPCNGSYSSSSCCCCCCDCCSSVPISAVASCRAVPVNPSPFYGFRQSRLIQWPPSRRRPVLGGGYRALAEDLGRSSDRDVVRKCKGKGIGLWGYGRVRVVEERCVLGRVRGCSEDADALLSLLTEDVGEECLNVNERREKARARLFDKGKVRDRYKLRKEDDYGGPAENVGVQHRKDGSRMRGERRDLVKSEGLRLGKGGSSSSYFTCSDLDDYENVSEEESSGRVNEKVIYLDSERNGVDVRDSSESDLRRRLKKKHTEESVEDTAYRNNVTLGQSLKGSILKKPHPRGELISDVISSDGLRRGIRRTDNRVNEISESSHRYEHVRGSSDRIDKVTTNSLSRMNGREENVVSACEFCRTCGQVTSDDHRSEKRSKLSKIQDANTAFISDVDTRAESRVRRGEESSRLLQNSDIEVNEQHLTLRKSQSSTERADAALRCEKNANFSRRSAQHSGIQDTGMRLNTTAGQQSESRIKRQGDNSTMLESSEKLNERNRREHLVATSQTDLIRKNTKHAKSTVVGEGVAHGTSRVQHQQEAHMKGSKDILKTVSSQLAMEDQNLTDIQVTTSQRQSRKAAEDVSGSSQVHVNERMTAASRRASEQRLHYEQSYLKERLKSVEQRTESHERVSERVKQTEIRYEVQRRLRQASSHEKKEMTRPPYRSSASQIRIEEISGEEDETSPLPGPSPTLLPPPQSIERHPTNVEPASRLTRQDSFKSSEGEPSIYISPPSTAASSHGLSSGTYEEPSHPTNVEPSPTLPPPPQSIERHPTYVEPASRLTRQDSFKSSEGEPSVYIYPPSTAASSHGLSSGTYEEPSHLTTDVDLLGSAERMNRASHEVLGHFIEKATHEASTSEIQTEKASSERTSEPGSDTSKVRKQYSRRSSSSRTAKGPADEMWTVQEPPEREASESAPTAGNDTTGRSGKTLWNVLADVARFRWVSRAESRKSPVKSGAQSPSGESANSEAWFSGHDPDEAQAANVKRGNSSTSQEPSSTDQPLVARTPSQSPRGGLRVPSTGDHAGLAVDSAPSSSSRATSGRTDLGLNADEVTLNAAPSFDWSRPGAFLWRSHIGSNTVYEPQEGGKEASRSSTEDQIRANVNPSATSVSGSEENAAELKQRKLLRNTQVMKERFDDWEEAYRLESEQRNSDEIFMREALEEAKKAADLWEVPVGAVLVKDGKIIARGYNLVEDLRDSTAHAEMICIREASRFLKTWRLSETTLYVTLEPCAMCAGAILQARVGTLVYGAPNKLLGADGSWIRLFPVSAEGEGSSESTVKPEGPVHPFHPNMKIRRGVLESECAAVMQQFFRLRRKQDKKNERPEEQQSGRKLLRPSKLLHQIFHVLFCL